MIAKGKNTITTNDIYSKVSELDILAFYLGIEEIPTIINSPLRVDNNPSFGLYTKDGNRIYYRDLRSKEQGGLFDLLCCLWKVSFKDAMLRVYNDMLKIETNTCKIRETYKVNSIRRYSSDTNLECRIRAWRDYDLEYWQSFGINKEWLEFGDVYPISHLILTKNDNKLTIGAEKYAYAYVERKDGNVTLKIYQPFSERHKWSNKHDASVWDLWSKLPDNGDRLIITSSRKDALNLWSNTGIPTVSLQGEGYIPKKHVIDELKNRFKIIYVFFDNDFNNPDNPGRNNSTKLASEFDLIQIEIPDKYEAKDPSDLYKKYGKEIYLQILKEIIK